MNPEPKPCNKERTILEFFIQITKDLTSGIVEPIIPTHPFIWRVEILYRLLQNSNTFWLGKWMRWEKLRKGTLHVIV